MNRFIEFGSATSIPLYNCSHIPLTPEQWSEKDGVSRPIFGATEFTFGMLIEILYIPLIVVMLEKKNFSMSCYKIMVFLALIDFVAVIFSCLMTGFLTFQGAVFCTYPNLIYISGCTAKCTWTGSCLTAMILVINRLLDLSFNRIKNILFDGNRTFLILIIPFGYASYFLIFNPPIVFTSKFHSWFFDPLIFEGRSAEYNNIPVLFNNFLIVITTCCLYMFFCCALGAKTKNTKTSSQTRKMSLQIFFQSAMICAVNFSASMIYVIMNYVEVPFSIILFGQFTWQMGSASPVFIYLTLNKTIRNGVLLKLGLTFAFGKTSVVSKTSAALVVQVGNRNVN